MLNQGQVLNIEEVVTPVTPVAGPGFMESLKNSIHPEAIAHKLGMNKDTLVDIGLYGAIGFITGFLLKRYSEYFIACAFFIIGAFVLQHYDYISISVNTAKIHDLLGLEQIPMAGDKYGTLLLDWMKANVAGAASLFVGFLIGLKVG